MVRGAKVHISASPCANELLCLPCRTHGEADKDYALAFAVPVNTPGVKLFGSSPTFDSTVGMRIRLSDVRPDEAIGIPDPLR